MTTYSIELTDESADSIVRDVIRNSIEDALKMGTSDDLADAKFLIEAYNFYSCPDQWLSLEDFEEKL